MNHVFLWTFIFPFLISAYFAIFFPLVAKGFSSLWSDMYPEDLLMLDHVKLFDYILITKDAVIRIQRVDHRSLKVVLVDRRSLII